MLAFCWRGGVVGPGGCSNQVVLRVPGQGLRSLDTRVAREREVGVVGLRSSAREVFGMRARAEAKSRAVGLVRREAVMLVRGVVEELEHVYLFINMVHT